MSWYTMLTQTDRHGHCVNTMLPHHRIWFGFCILKTDYLHDVIWTRSVLSLVRWLRIWHDPTHGVSAGSAHPFCFPLLCMWLDSKESNHEASPLIMYLKHSAHSSPMVPPPSSLWERPLLSVTGGPRANRITFSVSVSRYFYGRVIGLKLVCFVLLTLL